jgi:drug/metabolite transporter (DMT)-like permease
MNAGVIGGIIGAVIGIGGGIVGTWCSIRNTRGPRERAFMIRASAVAWIAITIFLALLLLLPHPWRLWMWIPYGILLPLGIIYLNRHLAEIRQQEQADE